MRIVLLLFLLIWNLAAFCQKGWASVYDKHRFACDSGTTQLEMNICSAEKADFADSLINRLYRKMIRSLDLQIIEKTNILRKRSLDSSGRAFVEMERKRYLDAKQALIVSQRRWKEYRDADCDLERVRCEGGSACNYIVNSRYIDMTLARIADLEELDLLY